MEILNIFNIFLFFFHRIRGKGWLVDPSILIENSANNDFDKTLFISTDITKVSDKLNYFESARINWFRSFFCFWNVK